MCVGRKEGCGHKVLVEAQSTSAVSAACAVSTAAEKVTVNDAVKTRVAAAAA